MSRQFIISVILLAAGLLAFSLSAQGRQDKESRQIDNAELEKRRMEDAYGAIAPPGTGRDYRKPGIEELKESLSPLQFDVTQLNGTERAFQNEFWDNKEEGIYVDIVSGEPLFSSGDKYKSGTGWPSFTKPIAESNIINISDTSYGMERTEVRSLFGDSHLGHLFNDGPEPTGLRYCINSASLRFIPVEDLEKEGYSEFLNLFSMEK